MTETEYMKLLEPLNEAEKDDTPFLVQGDKETMVVGDPNKTEIKKVPFSITFCVPGEDGSRKMVTKEYPDVFVKPRYGPRITRAMSAVLPYFRKINDDGTVAELTPEDITAILSTELPEILFDEMYNLVCTVLGIDERLKDYMMPGSVFDATMLIFRVISGVGE